MAQQGTPPHLRRARRHRHLGRPRPPPRRQRRLRAPALTSRRHRPGRRPRSRRSEATGARGRGPPTARPGAPPLAATAPPAASPGQRRAAGRAAAKPERWNAPRNRTPRSRGAVGGDSRPAASGPARKGGAGRQRRAPSPGRPETHTPGPGHLLPARRPADRSRAAGEPQRPLPAAGASVRAPSRSSSGKAPWPGAGGDPAAPPRSPSVPSAPGEARSNTEGAGAAGQGASKTGICCFSLRTEEGAASNSGQQEEFGVSSGKNLEGSRIPESQEAQSSSLEMAAERAGVSF